jgi:hypothetical protein
MSEKLVMEIAFGFFILCICAGGINELIYFNNLCRRTKKGYQELQENVQETLNDSRFKN